VKAEQENPFTGRASIPLEEIAEHDRLGWVDMHPENYCHRCGGRNFSWYIDDDIWNAVMRPDGDDAPWRWHEIICPQCFGELFEQRWPLVTLAITISEPTIGAKAFRAWQASHNDRPEPLR
jgi:hypothetical protein